MTHQLQSVAPILSWLAQDELHNMIPIAGLTHLEHPEVIIDDPTEPHTLLLVGQAAQGSWDAAAFPAGWRRVISHSDEQGDLGRLFRRLKPGQTYLIKVPIPPNHDHLQFGFDVERQCRLVYLTVTQDGFRPVAQDGIVPLSLDDPQTLAALAESGRTKTDIARHRYVQGFGLWQDGNLVACAFAMGKTERVCEICGVYTSPSYRQQGLATAVVSATTQHILQQGWIPCYGTRDWKRPSLNLAKGLGFWYYQHVDYYLAKPRR